MLDINTEEELVQLVGGKFKLTSLIQKRIVELNRGAPPLVEFEDNDEPTLKQTVIKEILEGKIELGEREELDQALQEAVIADKPEDAEGSEGEGDEDGEGTEVYGSDIKKIKEQRIKELAALLNQKK
ncbi:MAG: DNA-directed RNA polymerase subunit omega [Planctomycetota bacterium]|jgi:DNA-directed RNA polymerase subunit omega|nr:DNA-directed RNA polymerase subunit omega [Planctomycetota bacterium]MEC9032912.1 DNA-directed RNA polymerase subunit omega [Planctomycetota bacterium]MEE3296209.1 DNA-directed RNA polymerase subunit omega [Planctomycetota bacterium]|tara:strand:- start:283 stop:663 length:381 start_codon:yes stop_codon:yes gene_type:complete